MTFYFVDKLTSYFLLEQLESGHCNVPTLLWYLCHLKIKDKKGNQEGQRNIDAIEVVTETLREKKKEDD